MRKIVTGQRQSPCGTLTHATNPLTHGFTVAASLHRATVAGFRERGHTAAALSTNTSARRGGGSGRPASGTRGTHGTAASQGRHEHAARPQHGTTRRDAERVLARSNTDTRPPTVAMAKRPGSRARPSTQPPDPSRPSANSRENGVNKPAARLLLTQ